MKFRDKLTIEDVRNCLRHLKVSFREPDFGTLVMPTVCHGGTKEKLYYYDNSKLFTCYTECDCSFDIIDLFVKVLNIDKALATRMVSNIIGDGITGYESRSNEFIDLETGKEIINKTQVEKDLESMARMLEEEDKKNQFIIDSKKFNVYNPNYVNRYQFYLPIEWESEDITLETLKVFNIRYDFNKDNVIIPYYHHENGNLVGVRCRLLNREAAEKYGKYLPMKIESTYLTHPIGDFLFGLYQNRENIRRTKKAVIFEGEKSVLKSENLGRENNISVAVSGYKISPEQVILLKELGVEQILLAFDKQYKSQYEFDLYRKKMLGLKEYLSFFFHVQIVVDEKGMLGYKESPIDRGIEVFNRLSKI